MTAGRGISHSELSTPDTRVLHGVQLWVVLPDGSRQQAPHFENHVIPAVEVGDGPGSAGSPTGSVLMRVFAGSLGGQTAAAKLYSPLLGAELTLAAGAAVTLAVDPDFEFGLLVDAGSVTLGSALQEDELLVRPELGYLPPGQSGMRIKNVGGETARVMLIGGEPFDEKIVMWWNFIGRSHEEIAVWRDEWQSEAFEGRDAAGRFGTVVPASFTAETSARAATTGKTSDAYDGLPLPAPEMPGVRLKPR
jgi:redox-sensitive bicupin YhaK (pirin superfamily)